MTQKSVYLFQIPTVYPIASSISWFIFAPCQVFASLLVFGDQSLVTPLDGGNAIRFLTEFVLDITVDFVSDEVLEELYWEVV